MSPAAVPLSVIIPTYNRAGHVRRCLESLRESGLPDLEVIVADDGSTDDTAAVVKDTFPEAVYLWAPNSGGPSGPRNRGFAASHGRYVGFLDCDDRWLAGMPARAVAILDRHPELDVLFADANYGNPEDGFVSIIEYAGREEFPALPRHELEPDVCRLEREPFFRLMIRRNQVFLGATVIRREAFESVGGFNCTYWGGEDWEACIQLSLDRTFGFWDAPFAEYTRHDTNITLSSDYMNNAFCLALVNVLKTCHLSAENRELVLARLRQLLFYHAYAAYDRQDYPVARRRLSDLIRKVGPDPKALAYLAACTIPPIARGLRWGKHHLGV